MHPSQCLEILYQAAYTLILTSHTIFVNYVSKSARSSQCLHLSIAGYLPHDLQQARYVFIRRDAHRTPLQRPYEGPFKVIQPGPKTFIVDVGGKNNTISVDRLKPAYMDLEQPAEVAEPRRRRGRPIKHQPPQTTPDPPQPLYTRSGRRVKPAQQYISVLEGSGVAD